VKDSSLFHACFLELLLANWLLCFPASHSATTAQAEAFNAPWCVEDSSAKGPGGAVKGEVCVFRAWAPLLVEESVSEKGGWSVNLGWSRLLRAGVGCFGLNSG